MKSYYLWVTLVLLVACARPAQAQGYVEFAKDSPSPGKAKGTVHVRGAVALDKGWQIVGVHCTVEVWPKDGGAVEKFIVALTPDAKAPGRYTWSGDGGVLRSGDTYNVMILVPITNGKNTERLAVAKTADAK